MHPFAGKVTVVIPSASTTIRTLSSVPEGVETLVVTEGNRSQARNLGARRAKGEVIVFCDDDISFAEDMFWRCVNLRKDGDVVGLVGVEFDLLITRFMVVSKVDFNRVGGFDESLTDMEDTEFCIRAQKKGLVIIPLPRDLVVHFDHPGRITSMRQRLFFIKLFRRHPIRFTRLFIMMVKRRLPS